MDRMTNASADERDVLCRRPIAGCVAGEPGRQRAVLIGKPLTRTEPIFLGARGKQSSIAPRNRLEWEEKAD